MLALKLLLLPVDALVPLPSSASCKCIVAAGCWVSVPFLASSRAKQEAGWLAASGDRHQHCKNHCCTAVQERFLLQTAGKCSQEPFEYFKLLLFYNQVCLLLEIY